MEDYFDVIICGAGPAGCTAALALGSSGLRVALLEREMSPGEKVCGDAIPAFVPKVLNTIDPAYAGAFDKISDKNSISVCRITSPGQKTIDLKFPGHGAVCRRKVFDTFLSGLAGNLPGITFLRDTSVGDVSVNGTGAFVTTGKGTRLNAEIIIGCDGVSSIVRKKLAAGRILPGEVSVAVRGYFRYISDSSPDTIELHFLRDFLPGYFWIFPLPGDQFNVGLGMPARMITENRINLRQELLKIIEKDPALRRRFAGAELTGEIKGHHLPLFTAKSPVSGERFMLCGDAASLVNPATGGGIGQAMQSGRYAGWQALKCFEKKDFSADMMREYDRTVYAKIWNENLRYLRIRDYVLKHPARFDLFVRTGVKSRLLYNAILRMLG